MKRSSLIKITAGYFLIWLLSVLAFLFVTSSLLPRIINGTPSVVGQSWSAFWQSFANWDGGHYLGIAENGYITNYQYAFFPLYPLTIKIVVILTGNYLASALVISWVSFLLSLILFIRLLAMDFSKRLTERAVTYLLISPSAIFFIAVYSESFFLLLTMLSFYFLRKRKWLLSAIGICLASATRPIGIILSLPLLFEILQANQFNLKKFLKNAWVLFVTPLGLFSYMWFLEKTTDNPFIFIDAQQHWQRLPASPLSTFFSNYLEVASLKNIGSPFFAQQLLNLLTIILAIGIICFSFTKLRQSYFIFLGLATIVPLTTASTVSFIRLILPIFPIFIVLAIWGENRMFNFFWTFVSVMFFSLISALFINGYWIA